MTNKEKQKPSEKKQAEISSGLKKSAAFEEAARVLSSLGIENIQFSPEELRKKLKEDFQLSKKEQEELISIFSRKEEKNG